MCWRLVELKPIAHIGVAGQSIIKLVFISISNGTGKAAARERALKRGRELVVHSALDSRKCSGYIAHILVLREDSRAQFLACLRLTPLIIHHASLQAVQAAASCWHSSPCLTRPRRPKTDGSGDMEPRRSSPPPCGECECENPGGNRNQTRPAGPADQQPAASSQQQRGERPGS
jgi:hypothetical protein